MSGTWLTTLRVKQNVCSADQFLQSAVGPMTTNQLFTKGEDGNLTATVANDVAEFLLSRYPTVYEMLAPWAPLEMVLALQEKLDAMAAHIGIAFED